MAGSAFSIELDFATCCSAGGLNDEQKKVFELAARRWEEVVQGADSGTALVLIIRAAGESIDGPGRILGQAGPTSVRAEDGLPVSGTMEFDSADLMEMQQAGTLKDIILHEMGHVLGIGTLWESKGFLKGAGTDNPLYIGPKAMQEYATLLQETIPTPIPVANTGGPGTAGGHWRETTFDHELMTGYAEDTAGTPLSRMTVAALADLGYTVEFAAADDYTLPLHPAVVGTRTRTDHVERKLQQYCKTTCPKKVQQEKKKRWCGCC
jgi:hypothetical protein